MDKTPSPKQLAEEARRALKEAPMTSGEHFEFLVREGIIDRSGRALVARLFGDQDAEQTVATTASPPSTNGSAEQPTESHTGSVKQEL